VDTAARWLITLGGVFIIASILAMLVFLVAETIPLWGRARVHPGEARLSSLAGTSGPAPIVGSNEYREIVFRVTTAGRGTVVRASDGKTLFESNLPGLDGRRISASLPLSPSALDWLAGTDDGIVIRIGLVENLRFAGGGREYAPSLSAGDTVVVRPGHAIRILGASADENGYVCAAGFDDGTIAIVSRRERRTLLGDRRVDRSAWRLPLSPTARPSALAFGHGAERLYVGTEDGRIIEWDVSPNAAAPRASYQALEGSAVCTMGTLLGENSLVVGGSRGEVQVWFPARVGADDAFRLVRGHVFERHASRVSGTAASNRDKGFLTYDDTGEVRVHFSTTGRTLVRFDAGARPPLAVVMAPRADGILLAGAGGELRSWDLVNRHPEITFGSLFGKIRYEGYAEPSFVWQSTGATDETEPKLSLVPLIFGTLKGTFYALLISVPIAILAAVYTALFMRPSIRNLVKPAMELMAALPSVVLGLLAALWLAPRLQDSMPIGLAVPALAVAAIVLTGLGWARLPRGLTGRVRPGLEAFLMIPVLLIVLVLVLRLNPVVNGLFDGGFLDWLYRSFDARYDQRNALIVGLAMGVAVTPIIFSISEDALSSVPRHLTAGSLALGATPWQTAWRVVLPAASPGIFSAVMIGFGRAVGETMIVLMATGNTPIMDFSMFNGFRTLSANIAVEIPEAPQGGSLYRALFLTALLLFLITFIVNTGAELVRHRLRQRYSRF
jgi:phosphate transport system permease protein